MHLGPPLSITLVKKEFDTMHVHRLQQIKKDDEAGHIIAITMEEGIAYIFMISKHKTVTKAKITKSVAKRTARNESKHEKNKNKFFNEVIKKLEFLFKGDDSYSKVGCVVVGSPGFTRLNFQEYCKAEAEKRKDGFLKDVCSKMVVAHCSSGFKHSLHEIMADQTVVTTMNNMMVHGETAMLNKFFEMLAVCEDKVTYGPKSVAKAL